MEPPISLGERDLRDRKVDVLRSVRPLRLRTGKAMGDDRKEIIVHFRPVPHLPFEQSPASASNRLRFGLQPEGLTLELTGTGPGVALSLVPLTLSAEMEPLEQPAYGRILLDVLSGRSALSIRADEAEEAWRILTPVLDGVGARPHAAPGV